mmetsp:Transcript_66665/g.121564  ORF Transcript_66665/g.121564 Transcript_66665/m.121564 type:complete len:216 (+) Transcript_66665:135-782(+)
MHLTARGLLMSPGCTGMAILSISRLRFIPLSLFAVLPVCVGLLLGMRCKAPTQIIATLILIFLPAIPSTVLRFCCILGVVVLISREVVPEAKAPSVLLPLILLASARGVCTNSQDDQSNHQYDNEHLPSSHCKVDQHFGSGMSLKSGVVLCLGITMSHALPRRRVCRAALHEVHLLVRGRHFDLFRSCNTRLFCFCCSLHGIGKDSAIPAWLCNL